jgi:hypothetical protein
LPLTISTLDGMTDEQEECLDALILRYSQCVSMMQDHLFRGIALIEQEDISDKSNRDKALLMEKIGAIQSADAFGTAAMLRNKLAGGGLPLIAAAALIPFMLQRLAMVTLTEAFGVLTLIWALIGYFSLFDMGVGRALSYELSKLRAKPADDDQHNEISLSLGAGLVHALTADLACASTCQN